MRCFFCFYILLQRTLVGLVRDLRGIAFAFNAKTSFMMLFEWMYPNSDWKRIAQTIAGVWLYDRRGRRRGRQVGGSRRWLPKRSTVSEEPTSGHS